MEGRLLGGGGLVEGELVYGRSRDEAGRWQEEISHGFERLVALASRVDMRSALDSPHFSLVLLQSQILYTILTRGKATKSLHTENNINLTV